MQIKITMRYHLTSVRMAIINKSTNNECLANNKCGEKGTVPFALLVGMQIDAVTVENSVESPQKIKNETAL